MASFAVGLRKQHILFVSAVDGVSQGCCKHASEGLWQGGLGGTTSGMNYDMSVDLDTDILVTIDNGLHVCLCPLCFHFLIGLRAPYWTSQTDSYDMLSC